jgi:hypothetical protein
MIKENKKEWKVPEGDTVLPAKVRYSKQISQSAKLLYGDIKALSFKTGYCNASNEYFAFVYQVDDKTISAWVNELAKVGFIRSKVLRNFERKLYPQIVSLRESALIPEDKENTTGVSPLTDLTPSDKPDKIITSNIINNIDISEVSLTTNFSSKEELLKWKASNQRWLHIIGVYGLWKRLDESLKTDVQLKKLFKFRKVATDLSDFTDEQLRDAFLKCDSWKKNGESLPWTLYHIPGILLNKN